MVPLLLRRLKTVSAAWWVTVAEASSWHPPASVTVTLYVPAGISIAAAVAPHHGAGLHEEVRHHRKGDHRGERQDDSHGDLASGLRATPTTCSPARDRPGNLTVTSSIQAKKRVIARMPGT